MLRFHSADYYGLWVFREQLRFEGFEVRQRFLSVRIVFVHLVHPKPRADRGSPR